MKNKSLTSKNKFRPWINVVSVAVPVVVALLFKVRLPNVEALTFLPPIYAAVNGITAILLILALIAIKNKKITLHENLMKTAIVCSFLFLVMYVAYHMTSDSTKYLGEGSVMYLYYFILISHIILSIIVIPLVLISYLRAYLGEVELHKKIVRFAFPIWLYVAVTGVIVYLMISPYYI